MSMAQPPAAGAILSCPPGYTPYTIQAGDTLWRLARMTRTTVENLMLQNPGLDPCSLRVGQVVCVPFEAVHYPGYGVMK